MDSEKKLEIARSKVRIRVTYIMTVVYAVAALYIIYWLLDDNRVDFAIAVFSGIASTTASIIAFWFGTRQTQKSIDETKTPSKPVETDTSADNSQPTN